MVSLNPHSRLEHPVALGRPDLHARRNHRVLAALLAGAISMGVPAVAQDATQGAPADLPVQARGIDVEEHVGQTLPLELTFVNAQGKTVRLGDYFKGGKPAILSLVYYKCPVACQVVMQRMAETINELDYTVGKEYNALLFSFDPTETTRDARQAKIGFVSGYSKEVTPEVEAGWEFHTCNEDAARQLGDSLGFKFRKLDTGQYSHPVALFIITPDGRISRYLYGFSYPARDVKLALMEASEGKLVRTIGERLTFYCFMYDSEAGKYTLQVHRVMQIAGVMTAAGLGTLIGALFIGERIQRSRAAHAATAGAGSPPRVTTGHQHTTGEEIT